MSLAFRGQVRLDLHEQAKLGVKSAMRALELPDEEFNRTVDECESYATVTQAADAVVLCALRGFLKGMDLPND